jgi:Cu-processing system permease protein
MNFVYLVRSGLREALRGRWLAGLTVLLIGLVELLLRFSGSGPTLMVSLIDVALIITPLAGLVVGTVQVHQARDVTALLLAQPISRRQLFMAQYVGNVVPLFLALCIGLLAPLAWHGMLAGAEAGRFMLVIPAVAILALVSTALAYVIAIKVDDRMRALGIALITWLVGTVLWDGVVLMVALLFGNAAVEIPVMSLLAINPVDLVRVLLLLGSDAAMLMGFTGSAVHSVMGTAAGRVVVITVLSAWLILPLLLARRTFSLKDF